ncbi:hypothetical protein OPV22_028548 [Ensete ventricosum]|uniref:Amino acid transporter transmembrane domain-containing protein n=1 Tax=Ensete ventricosum TaxID=4639 RepID=A0AAV8Q8X7_ENSVE|nr:hypothetical protein OPV22_028548 [Ensete ventricosum]
MELSAPLRVVQSYIKLLGDGTVRCITLILGGNLRQGFHKSRIKSTVILAIVCVRCMILPAFGIGVVKAAYELGSAVSSSCGLFVITTLALTVWSTIFLWILS